MDGRRVENDSPDQMKVSPEEESTDLPFIAEKGPRDQTQASQLASTMILHFSRRSGL